MLLFMKRVNDLLLILISTVTLQRMRIFVAEHVLEAMLCLLHPVFYNLVH